MPVTEITELREKTMKLSQKCFVNATLDVFAIHLCGALYRFCLDLHLPQTQTERPLTERYELTDKVTFQKLKIARLVSKNHRAETVLKYRLSKTESLILYQGTD